MGADDDVSFIGARTVTESSDSATCRYIIASASDKETSDIRDLRFYLLLKRSSLVRV